MNISLSVFIIVSNVSFTVFLTSQKFYPDFPFYSYLLLVILLRGVFFPLHKIYRHYLPNLKGFSEKFVLMKFIDHFNFNIFIYFCNVYRSIFLQHSSIHYNCFSYSNNTLTFMNMPT